MKGEEEDAGVGKWQRWGVDRLNIKENNCIYLTKTYQKISDTVIYFTLVLFYYSPSPKTSNHPAAPAATYPRPHYVARRGKMTTMPADPYIQSYIHSARPGYAETKAPINHLLRNLYSITLIP